VLPSLGNSSGTEVLYFEILILLAMPIRFGVSCGLGCLTVSKTGHHFLVRAFAPVAEYMLLNINFDECTMVHPKKCPACFVILDLTFFVFYSGMIIYHRRGLDICLCGMISSKYCPDPIPEICESFVTENGIKMDKAMSISSNYWHLEGNAAFSKEIRALVLRISKVNGLQITSGKSCILHPS
jgi:hypothetical protein